MKHYVPTERSFRGSYKDVPYDYSMLNSGSESARLNGQIYTLENIRRYGGVCALQADYATRVGKSIGLPTAYVVGSSRHGDKHAWVMWVQLAGVNGRQLKFSLESEGRYRGDHFYVGSVRDPKSGTDISDRQLELRLHTVGVDVPAKRLGILLMKALPLIRQATTMDFHEELSYLRHVIALCPGTEEAWQALAKKALDVNPDDKRQRKLMESVVEGAFRTFKSFPDFTWTIFEDLIAFERNANNRIAYFKRLVSIYLSNKRPDLALHAGLRLADLLVAANRQGDAARGLMKTVAVFPHEGRYVPKMLDRLEDICKDAGKDRLLVGFYKALLPRIPKYREDRPSKYCVATYNRGIATFRRQGAKELANTFSRQLALIEASTGSLSTPRTRAP